MPDANLVFGVNQATGVVGLFVATEHGPMLLLAFSSWEGVARLGRFALDKVKENTLDTRAILKEADRIVAA